MIFHVIHTKYNKSLFSTISFKDIIEKNHITSLPNDSIKCSMKIEHSGYSFFSKKDVILTDEIKENIKKNFVEDQVTIGDFLCLGIFNLEKTSKLEKENKELYELVKKINTDIYPLIDLLKSFPSFLPMKYIWPSLSDDIGIENTIVILNNSCIKDNDKRYVECVIDYIEQYLLKDINVSSYDECVILSAIDFMKNLTNKKNISTNEEFDEDFSEYYKKVESHYEKWSKNKKSDCLLYGVLYRLIDICSEYIHYKKDYKNKIIMKEIFKYIGYEKNEKNIKQVIKKYFNENIFPSKKQWLSDKYVQIWLLGRTFEPIEDFEILIEALEQKKKEILG